MSYTARQLCHLFSYNAVLLLLVALVSGDKNPVLIGVADGITYFYGDRFYRTWDEAKIYCETSYAGDLKLARIKTRRQLEMLEQNIDGKPNQEQLWTAGRTAKGHQMYVWDHEENVNPDERVFEKLEETVDISACLAYKNGSLTAFPCKNRYFVLCESETFY